MKAKTLRAFVDSVEVGTARLIVADRVLAWPAALLPRGTGEGDWLMIRVGRAAPKEGTAAVTERRRRKLSKRDDGKDFKL